MRKLLPQAGAIADTLCNGLQELIQRLVCGTFDAGFPLDAERDLVRNRIAMSEFQSVPSLQVGFDQN